MGIHWQADGSGVVTGGGGGAARNARTVCLGLSVSDDLQMFSISFLSLGERCQESGASSRVSSKTESSMSILQEAPKRRRLSSSSWLRGRCPVSGTLSMAEMGE